MKVEIFHHQAVRDLAWALGSPPLMQLADTQVYWPTSRYYQQLYQQALPWLYEIDRHPEGLENQLDRQHDRRLGRYFETLWAYWLMHQKRYELVERNLQVVIDGKTLGEMDFILFDRQSRAFLHWELAIKFYLGRGDTFQMANWFGPACRDRLDKKVTHLQGRQSVLASTEPVRQWLAEKGIHIAASQVIMKGRLYYPLFMQPVRVMPRYSTTGHLYGVWMDWQDFCERANKDDLLTTGSREGWLASVSTDKNCKRMSVLQLIETLSRKDLRLPLHVNYSNNLFNKRKIFLVGQDWCNETT